MTRTRLLAATLAATLLWVGVPTTASAEEAAAGADNAAVAVNTKDGSDVFRLAFHVNRVMSDVVDSGNAAVAFASCTDCQTVAIAIQVVLIMSDPAVVTPENLALAVNLECSACDTLASAYQLVLTTGGPVRFTPEGYRRLAEIRRQLLALRHSGLSAAELQARVKELTDQLRQVVLTEMVPAGRAGTAPAQEGTSPTGEGPTTGSSGGTGSSPSTSTSTTASTTSTTSRTSTTSTTTTPTTVP